MDLFSAPSLKDCFIILFHSFLVQSRVFDGAEVHRHLQCAAHSCNYTSPPLLRALFQRKCFFFFVCGLVSVSLPLYFKSPSPLCFRVALYSICVMRRLTLYFTCENCKWLRPSGCWMNAKEMIFLWFPVIFLPFYTLTVNTTLCLFNNRLL